MAHLVSFVDTKPPIDPPQPPQATDNSESLKSINTARKLALLVESDDSLLRFLRRFLEDEGYRVRTASDSEEGIRLYDDCGPFNVVLINYDVTGRNGAEIDYRLPQTGGTTLASAIRKKNPSQGIIIAAPAYRTAEELCLPPELVHTTVLIDISIFRLRNLLERLELDRAIESLTAPDWLRLRLFAAFRILGLGRAARGRTGEDLLAEALLRTLTGAESTKGRHWNKSVDFVRHLAGAMQSISSSWKRKSCETEPYLASEVLAFGAEGQEISLVDNVASDEAGADQRLLAHEKVNQIFAAFHDDKDATRVLQGWFDGLKPKEIRQKDGLDENKYAAAVKRIRTRLLSGRSACNGSKQHDV